MRPRGLPASDAAAKWLPVLGAEAFPIARLLASTEAELSPARLASMIADAGNAARLLILEGGDIAHLKAPALLQLTDMTWIGVLSRRSRRLSCLTADGTVLLNESKVSAHTTGKAIELTAVPRRYGSVASIYGALMQEHYGTVLGILGLTMVFQIAILVPPAFVRVVVDESLGDWSTSVARVLGLGLVLSGAFQVWLAWLRGAALLYLDSASESAAVRSLLNSLLGADFSVLTRMGLGNLLQAYDGLAIAHELLNRRIVGAAVDVLVLCTTAAAMAWLLPVPAAAIVLGSIASLTIAALGGWRALAVQREEIAARATQRGFLADVLSGVMTIKAAGAEGNALLRWSTLLIRELRATFRRQRLTMWTEVGPEAVGQIVFTAALLWGAQLAIREQSTAGTLVAFLQLAAGFLTTVQALCVGLVSAWLGKVELAKTSLVLAAPARKQPSRLRREPAESSIRVEDVWFRYGPEDTWVVQGYSLVVEDGQALRLAGPSGSGKTTILRLIAGLYSPERGAIVVDGQEALAARGAVLYVPQFVKVYGASVRENLQFLSADAPWLEIVRCAELTGLAEMISEFAMGYDTILSPGGSNVSGGQRQLLALTAAAASRRSWLLLDEPMSNLDARLRRRIVESGLFRGKNLVYASHEAVF